MRKHTKYILAALLAGFLFVQFLPSQTDTNKIPPQAIRSDAVVRKVNYADLATLTGMREGERFAIMDRDPTTIVVYSATAGGTVDNGIIFDAPGAGTERFTRQYTGAADVEWFGAKTTETAANNVVALQAALTANVPLKADPAKGYPIDSNLIWSQSDGSTLRIKGLKLLPTGAITAFTVASSDANVSTTMTLQARTGRNYIHVGTGAAAYEVGDIIRIQSATAWQWPTGGGVNKGEMAVIESILVNDPVQPGNDKLTLTNPLSFGYNAPTEVVTVIGRKPVSVDLENMTIDYVTVPSVAGTTGFSINDCVGGRIEGCTVNACDSTGIGLNLSCQTDVVDCIATNCGTVAGGLGYAILCQQTGYCNIDHLVARNCRKGVDFSGSYPNNHNAIRNCNIIGRRDTGSCIDTHAGANHTTIEGNTLVSGTNGVQSRSPNMFILNNIFQAPGNAAISLDGTGNVTISGNVQRAGHYDYQFPFDSSDSIFLNLGSTTVAESVVWQDDGSQIVVENNRSEVKEKFIRITSAFTEVRRMLVRGNNVTMIYNGGGAQNFIACDTAATAFTESVDSDNTITVQVPGTFTRYVNVSGLLPSNSNEASNLTATVDPVATDDAGSGYAVGSRWVNVTLNKEFVCLDSTAAAAVWTETTGAGGGTDVTIAAGLDYATINGAPQVMTLGQVDVTTDITGIVPIANLATGVPNGLQFIRDDGTLATPAGGGDVSKVGIPVVNQIGIWTGDGTIKGDPEFLFDGTTNILSGLASITLSGTVDGRDVSVDGTKLDGIATGANLYVHPNHTGDVTSVADGATTIAVDAVDIPMLSAIGTADATTFLRGDNTWSVPAGGSGGADYQWQHDQATTVPADPGLTLFRTDNLTLNLVTEIYVDDQNLNGLIGDGIFGALQAGDKIYIQETANPANAILGTLTVDPVDNTGWWTITFTQDASAGTMWAASSAVSFSFIQIKDAGAYPPTEVTIGPNPTDVDWTLSDQLTTTISTNVQPTVTDPLTPRDLRIEIAGDTTGGRQWDWSLWNFGTIPPLIDTGTGGVTTVVELYFDGTKYHDKNPGAGRNRVHSQTAASGTLTVDWTDGEGLFKKIVPTGPITLEIATASPGRPLATEVITGYLMITDVAQVTFGTSWTTAPTVVNNVPVIIQQVAP